MHLSAFLSIQVVLIFLHPYPQKFPFLVCSWSLRMQEQVRLLFPGQLAILESQYVFLKKLEQYTFRALD